MAATVPSRREVADVGAILGVAGLLVGVHFLLPDAIHPLLVFDHDRFRVYTLWTAAFVHAGNDHLFANVLGYLLPVIYVYVLCFAVNELRWFRRVFLAFLTVFPILVSLGSYAIFSLQYPGLSPTSQGFSGVAAGFGGLLLVTLAVYVRNQYSQELAQVVGLSVFLILLLIVDIIYAGRVRLIVAGLVSFGIVLQVGAYLWEHDVDYDSADKRQLLIDSMAVVVVFGVIAYIVVALFPADIVSNGRTTNIFAHAAGFVFGVVLSIICYWIRE